MVLVIEALEASMLMAEPAARVGLAIVTWTIRAWLAAATAMAAPAGAESYFRHHIFFCLNQRDNGKNCCAQHGAEDAFDHCKKLVKRAGLSGPGGVRVNRAGCLGRCKSGPVAVVYPEGTWYTYVDKSDIDEIVESHLKDGVPVVRLLVDAPSQD